MIFPILPLFAKTLKATPFDIGILAASFSFAQFLTSPILGRISDRVGRKPIIFLSILGSAVSFLIAAFAHSLWGILVSRILHGVSSAGNFPTAQAFIADTTTKKERTFYMGKISAFFALGFVVGPVFGGVLGAKGFFLAFFSAAIVSFINLIFISFMLPESLSKKSKQPILTGSFLNVREIYHGLRGDFGMLFFLLFSWAFYVSNFQVAIPLFTESLFKMGPFENGIFFSTVGVFAAITQWLILPYTVRRFKELATIFLGLLCMVFGQIFAPLFPSVFLFYAFFMISVLGSGLTRPTVNAVLSKATKAGQGATLGLGFSFESLGRVLGPLIAGIFISRFGLAFPFWVSSGVLAIGLYFFWRIEIAKKGRLL